MSIIQDFLFAHNGFSSVYIILLLSFLMPILSLIQLYTLEIIEYKHLDIEKEIREIKAIRIVQDAFKKGEDLDESFEIENENVDVIVLGYEAIITMEDVIIELTYDDVFMCIQDITYIAVNE